MINLALAIAVGIIAVVTLAYVFTRETVSNSKKAADELRKIKLYEFLNYLDDTREERYASFEANRSDDFRSDWYDYEDEWDMNFSMS